ncbi:MAG: hypothetical protein AAFQ39_02295 [Pseudomonadota bacterium]
MAQADARAPRPKADPVDPTHKAAASLHPGGPGLHPTDTTDAGARPVPRAEPVDTYVVNAAGDVDPATATDAERRDQHGVRETPKKGRAAFITMFLCGIAVLVAIYFLTA